MYFSIKSAEHGYKYQLENVLLWVMFIWLKEVLLVHCEVSFTINLFTLRIQLTLLGFYYMSSIVKSYSLKKLP